MRRTGTSNSRFTHRIVRNHLRAARHHGKLHMIGQVTRIRRLGHNIGQVGGISRGVGQKDAAGAALELSPNLCGLFEPDLPHPTLSHSQLT